MRDTTHKRACIYTRTYTPHTHTHVRTNTHTHMRAHAHTRTYTRTHRLAFTHNHTCMYTNVHTHTQTHTHRVKQEPLGTLTPLPTLPSCAAPYLLRRPAQHAEACLLALPTRLPAPHALPGNEHCAHNSSGRRTLRGSSALCRVRKGSEPGAGRDSG